MRTLSLMPACAATRDMASHVVESKREVTMFAEPCPFFPLSRFQLVMLLHTHFLLR